MAGNFIHVIGTSTERLSRETMLQKNGYWSVSCRRWLLRNDVRDESGFVSQGISDVQYIHSSKTHDNIIMETDPIPLPYDALCSDIIQNNLLIDEEDMKPVIDTDTEKNELRYAVLTYEQVKRLDQVMNEIVPLHGRGNFPTLEIRLRDLVKHVRSQLQKDGVNVRDLRLNGGAASYILASEKTPYNDLDLIFLVDLSNPRNFDKIKTAVLDSLLDFLPEGVKRMSSCSLKEAYVHKMVKVTDSDRWSLISLSNKCGRNVELKFVDKMRRQFEFSVDSFQIVLDSLLLFYDCAEMPMTETFYPTVIGDSVYGDFSEALYHLQKKLIATRNPEEIRGGGLLKYCNLLVRDYVAEDADQIKTLERYMCSRFFIDFGDITQQRIKLENYLATHFIGDDHCKYDYLMILHQVVDESTVCLMGYERRQTLALIEELAYQVYFQEQQRLATKLRHRKKNCRSNRYVFGEGYFYTPYMSPSGYPSCNCSNRWMSCA